MDANAMPFKSPSSFEEKTPQKTNKQGGRKPKRLQKCLHEDIGERKMSIDRGR